MYQVANPEDLPVPGKLVRDRIPAVIEAAGGHPVVSFVGGPVYARALLDKLAEETAELCLARTEEDLLAEAADVLEVVHALLAAHHVDPARLGQVAAAKRAERGGFAQGCWLHDSGY